jgi:hypothetical protein
MLTRARRRHRQAAQAQEKPCDGPTSR